MSLLRSTAGLSIVCFLAFCPPASGAVPSRATRTFLGDHPDVRPIVREERLIALYGEPLATDADPATGTDTFVEAFLQEDGDALGVDDCVLQLTDKIDIRDGKFRVYTYVQKIAGLPVHGSVVKLPVLLGDTEKIVYAGVQLVPNPDTPLPGDAISAADAIDNVAQSEAYGHLTEFSDQQDASKVIYEATDRTLHRTWRFFGWSGDEAYRFFVDTSSGAIVGVEDQTFRSTRVPVGGKVEGYATPCYPPDDSHCTVCEAGADQGLHCTSDTECPESQCVPASYPCCPPDIDGNSPELALLSGVLVSAFEGIGDECAEPPVGPSTEDEFTDDAGTYDFMVPLPARVASRLFGEWVEVVNCGGALGHQSCFYAWLTGDPQHLLGDRLVECEYVPGTCVGGVDDGQVCNGQNCNDGVCTHDDPVDLLFNPSDHVPYSFATAQVNAFVSVQKTHDWFKSLQPNFTGIDQGPLPCFVNVNVPLEGYFPHLGPSIAFGTPGFVPGFGHVNNAAFSTIVSHEYGHFVLDRLLGRPGGKFGEGVADTVAVLAFNTERWGFDYCNDRQAERNVDLPDFPLDGCLDQDESVGCQGCNTEYQCSTDSHCMGLALAGAFWDVQKDFYCCSDTAEGPCSEPVTVCTDAGDCGGELCISQKGLRCCASPDDPEGPCLGGETITLCSDDADCSGGVCSDRATEELFADFLFITDGRLDSSVLVEVLIADDNDGNLGNGTPHEQAIRAAFMGHHDWPDPSCDPDQGVDDVITVQWHPTPGTPTQGVDYFVDYFLQDGVCLPSVTLKTTEKDIPVQRWFAGRTVDALPADLGTVHANWASPSDNWIIVEVGTRPETPCKDVNVVEIARPETETEAQWSSIVLQLGGVCVDGTNAGSPCDENVDCSGGYCSAGDMERTCVGGSDEGDTCSSDADCNSGVCSAGNLMAHAQCYADDLSDGGRISGTVAGMAERVFAQAIGLGGSGAGKLEVAGTLKEMTLATVPPGSRLVASAVGASEGGAPKAIDITGALHGAVEIRGDLKAPIAVFGTEEPSTGDILVDGDIAGVTGDTVAIFGAMSGTIRADADSDGDGVITGVVNVLGEFSGDICDAHLSPGGPLPLPNNITFGLFSGTICGKDPCSLVCPPEPDPHVPDWGFGTKNRYLSFMPTNYRYRSAVRVRFVDLPEPFHVLNNKTMWMGKPQEVSENAGKVIPAEAPGFPTFWAAKLQCDPYYEDWTGTGVVHLYHNFIVPGGTYEVQGIMEIDDPDIEANYSVPLEVKLSRWGDVARDFVDGVWRPPDGSVGIIPDVVPLVDKFRNVSGAPIKARCDLEPSEPDRLVNISDAVCVIDAFRGYSYPFEPVSYPCEE